MKCNTINKCIRAFFLQWVLYNILTLFSFTVPLYGQNPKVSFKDSIDHKLDMSDWVLTAHGFMPVPTIITEPAVGGFGGGLFAVFIKPNTPYIDTVKGQVVKTHAKATIYGVGGIYTINGTWALGAATQGVIKKWRSVYRVVGAYADANLTFYKQFQEAGEQSFEFNMRVVPMYGQLLKEFGHSHWSAGANYLWLKTKLMRTNSEFHEPEDVESTISLPGLVLDYDNRDNDFTPNKGLRWNTVLNTSAEWLGSDYTYYAVNSAVYTWIPVSDKIYSGYRAEYQQMWEDAPFFMLPYITLRGIPAARYQGWQTFVAETEWRWDFTKRWSMTGFGGAGKAIQKDYTFSESAWRWAGGMGGRYLIARKLKLRAGVDVARGPEEWAYYIVLGSYWAR